MSKKSILIGLLLASSVILLAACGQQASQTSGESRLTLQSKPVLQKTKKLNKPRLITKSSIRIS